jgi:hypothetical protein
MTGTRDGSMRTRTLGRSPLAFLAVCAVLLCVPAVASAKSSFEAGAASVDITPPERTPANAEAMDAAFVPACGTTPKQVAELWPGPRPFAFEKPYRDEKKQGKYATGDAFCESDGSKRYEAPYIAGGGGVNHWPTSVDPGNGVGAEAIVLSLHGQRVAIVSVDSIGLFNVTMDRIRAAVLAKDPSLSAIYISSTHDESAPDPIGLWGPELETPPESPELPVGASSGVDEYYFNFLVERVAGAVVEADHSLHKASLDVAMASMPSNTQSCWSSYPYIDDQSMPVLQAREPSGHVIFTLADVSTHAETLAFSAAKANSEILSADWPGRMRAAMQARWPGSVGVEVAGMVGSVETPTVYTPESTQVLRVPGSYHTIFRPENPDECHTVYPNPSSGTPVEDPKEFNTVYGKSVADTTAAALETGRVFTPKTLKSQQQPVCVELENNLFKAAFAAGLFPDRNGYVDSNCTVEGKSPTYLKTNVGVLTLGLVQLAYSPGEVFPLTEMRGFIDEKEMPFPTNCYEPEHENYFCGTPLPITPWITAEMTQPYRFLVGLGEDMIGYIMPPGDFVGGLEEDNKEPWLGYQKAHEHGTPPEGTGHDRFGHGHSDDTESVGPYASIDVTEALRQLLASDGHASKVVPGLYVDAAGHLSDSPFANGAFAGAVGVETTLVRHKKHVEYMVGRNATGWATFDALRDPGTAGTSLPYSVRTGGVIVHGKPLLIDVFAGARAFGL